MKKLDIDRDGQITEKEMYRVLSSVEAPHNSKLTSTSQVVENTLRKILSGADDINDLRAYSKKLIVKFDKNNDGIISFQELTDGLKKMQIFLSSDEKDALMHKLDINKDGDISDMELFQALSSVNTREMHDFARQAAEVALKKLASGAEEYSSMRDYCKALIRKFDYDNDGIITFKELCDGVKSMNIVLTLKERQALMSALDLNQDGQLSNEELYEVLSKVDVKMTKGQLNEQIDHALRKIASGAEDYSSMKEYVRVIMHTFDQNSDGFISFEELTEGLKKFQIFLTSQEKSGLMKRLDFNRDGEISEEEIYRVLAPFDNSRRVNGGRTLSPEKVSLAAKQRESTSVYDTVEKIKKNASKYQSLKHFVSAMMRRYDTDGDGSLNFKELFDGLNHDNLRLSKDECLALMKHIDVDCDG
jgi:Ca2+-binding EF-hand superfamily protein